MAPTPAELRAFCDGTLTGPRFAEVDAWLAAADPATADAALAAADVGDQPPLVVPPPAPAGFVSEPGARYQPGATLGEGGMARVYRVHDRVLDRTVAVKVLRPRRVDESLADFRLREAAFRREAAVLARLDHPSIPPVHDVGRLEGLPAFALPHLAGRTLADLAPLPLADALDLLRHVAEAVAHAHAQGIVHRDLSPANVLRSAPGAVWVLDWGLAVPVGTADGVRVGTPGFTAPEQQAGAPAAATADVYALGALGVVALTGRTLAPIAWDGLPPAVAALLRRCLAPDPQDRYADAAAVAEDLRRWFAEGVTAAQDLRPWERALLGLRRSRRLRLTATVVAVALLAGGAALAVAAHRATTELRQSLDRLQATPLEDAGAVAVALDEARALAARRPDLAEPLRARLQAAHDLAQARASAAAVRATLAGLLHRTRTRGPGTDQVSAWRVALTAAGLALVDVPSEADRLRLHPQRDDVLPALAFLWRCAAATGDETTATATAHLLAAGGPTPAWAALGRLLGRTTFDAHDPVFCQCDDTQQVLTELAPTAVAQAIFGPEPRLAATARTVLEQRPGDFWSLMAAGRNAWATRDLPRAEQVALIASGVEPDSALPHLLRAYTALARGDGPTMAEAATRALALAPDDLEALALGAVARARAGDLPAARALWSRIPTAHLHHHLHHPTGHPMESSVQAALAAGLVVGEMSGGKDARP